MGSSDSYDIGLDYNVYGETLFVTQRYLMLNDIRELGLDISINNIHTVCMEIQILHMVSTAHFS